MSSMSAERRCEVCDSSSHSELYVVNGYRIVRCTRCGLVFVADCPTPEQLLGLYDESYYEDPAAVGYGGYGEAEDRKRHHNRSLLAEIERLRAPGDLLELGCAYGYFLDEARERGWRVQGVEPSAHAVAYSRERLELDVTQGTLTDLPVQPNSVDAVALWDVIEHLPNPRNTIEVATAWLRPGGVLGLSTGDIGSLSARLHGADWSLMTPPWHQFYFTRPTLRRLLGRCGLEVVKIGGDGTFAVDPASPNPRIRGRGAALLRRPAVTRAARKLGAGAIMFAFARKPVP